MTEDQKSICDWAEKAFGPVTSLATLAARAVEEMTELQDAVQARDVTEIGREAADIVVLLYRIMDHAGLSLTAEVDAKMVINRWRGWRPAGDGTGRHIKI